MNNIIPQIGIDIVDYDEIKITKNHINHILTSKEKKEYDNFKSIIRKKTYFFGRWAAKEAVFKATNINLPVNAIEILNNDTGVPYLNYPKINNLTISISHNKKTAVAVALWIKNTKTK